MNEEGHWITLENGTHIFIKEGQSVEEAIKENFDKDDLPEKEGFDEGDWYDKREDYSYAFVKSGVFKIGKNATKETKETFINQLNNRNIYNKDLENLIINNISKLEKIKILDDEKQVRGGTWYNRYKKYLTLCVSSWNPFATLHNLTHEMGHCIDNKNDDEYLSSTFLSKKYGSTLDFMIKEEFSKIKEEDIIKFRDELSNSANETRIKFNEIRGDKNFYEFIKTKEAKDLLELNSRDVTSVNYLGDITQSCLGEDKCKILFNNYLGHSENYFNTIGNRGTELFAELIDTLVNDKNKKLYNFIKKHCPKSIDIFNEIIKEASK